VLLTFDDDQEEMIELVDSLFLRMKFIRWSIMDLQQN